MDREIDTSDQTKDNVNSSLQVNMEIHIYVPSMRSALSCALEFHNYDQIGAENTLTQRRSSACFYYTKDIMISYQCVSLTPGLTPGVLGVFDSKLPPPFCASPSAAYFLRSDMEIALSAD